MREVIESYVECERYGLKGCYIEENREQGVISNWQRWYGYQKRKETKAVCPKKRKAQQSSIWTRVPEDIAKKEE